MLLVFLATAWDWLLYTPVAPTICNFPLLLCLGFLFLHSCLKRHFTSITLSTNCCCVYSHLSKNVFTVAIKVEALLIKCHVVSSTINRAGSITLVGSALPFPICTSAVNTYRWDNTGLTIKDICLYFSVTDGWIYPKDYLVNFTA